MQDPSLAKPWARRLSKICRRRNSELGDLLLPPWRSQQAATRAGWIFCRLPDASENLLGEYACTVCRKFFSVLSGSGLPCQPRARKNCRSCSCHLWLALRDLQPGILDYAGTAPAHAAEITIQADLLPAPVRGEIGGAWLPAVTVQGPRPWWATLRPAPIEDGPAPTPISGWESIFSLLSSKCSEEPAFLASSLVELAVKHHLSAEERPPASLGRKHSDLLFVAFFVVELRHTGRPGIAQGSH